MKYMYVIAAIVTIVSMFMFGFQSGLWFGKAADSTPLDTVEGTVFDRKESWDNGRNLAWIPLDFSHYPSELNNKALDAVQDWIDANPDKTIVTFSSDNSYGEKQSGWLIIFQGE